LPERPFKYTGQEEGKEMGLFILHKTQKANNWNFGYKGKTIKFKADYIFASAILIEFGEPSNPKPTEGQSVA
jgi:hypothetical protein